MKHSRFYFIVLILSALLSLSPVCKAGQQDSNDPGYIFKTEFVVMEDGIKLATDVYLPIESGQYPCVLVRTPYNKQSGKGEAEWFVKNGFTFVVQDCRGKFASEGKFYPFRNERADGLATVEWIREQSWSNKKIGGFGGSYVGYTQWAISDVLNALTAHITGADVYDVLYPDGLFSLATAFNWGLAMDSATINQIPPKKISASYTILPLSVADDLTYADNRFVNDWLSHPSNNDYWKSQSHRGMAKCPVLSIGGWYDIFLMDQLNDFQALLENGHPDSRIVIGPWCHGPRGVKNDYGGIEKTGQRDSLIRRFIAKQLRVEGVNVFEPPFKDKKYNLFIMERNEYYGADQWPPKATAFTPYYIGSNKYFAREMPQDEGKLEYTYDPADPYPSKGGTLLGSPVGPALQNDNLSREDQLVFETGVFKSPLILLGPIEAVLYVDTDVSSTDFIVCLQHVFPNGSIINVQEGGKTVDFEKSGIKKVRLSVWATGYQVNPGHKLRAVVTSSWFPRFNRNLNSSESIFSAKTIKTARQKIYFGPKHPSSVILPILKLED